MTKGIAVGRIDIGIARVVARMAVLALEADVPSATVVATAMPSVGRG